MSARPADAFRLTAAAVKHVGWWLEWQCRVRPSDACRELEQCA